MLSKLFKPKWQHRDPAVRLRALHSLNPLDARDGEALRALATDDDSSVRRAALERIAELGLLRTLAGQSPEGRARYLGRLRELERAELAAELPHLQALQAGAELACEHPSPEARQLLLAALDDEQRLQVALHGHTSQNRQAAVEALQDEQALERAYDALKQRDKGAAQRAKSKLDALRQAAREHARQRDAALAMLAKLEQLSRASNLDGLYAHQLEHLARQWQELGTGLLDDSEQARGSSALATAQQRLAEEHAREAAAREAVARAEASREAQIAVLEQLERARDSLHAELPAAEDEHLLRLRADVAGILSITQNAWEEACEETRPASAEAHRYQDLIQHLHAASEALQSLVIALNQGEPSTPAISWPRQLPAPPQLKQHTPAPAAAKHSVDDQDLKASKRALEQHLAQLELALEGGHLHDTTQPLKQAQQALAENPELARRYDSRLRNLSARVQELRDWQRFATLPKQEALCEEMEALADNPLPGEQQAERLKALQDSWRALGNTGANGQSLWKRFQDAGDRAYAPVKAHQAQLRALRQHNLEQRLLVCDQLELYARGADWTQPDWKACGNIIHTARQEWRRLHPVDRKDGQAAQERFDAVVGELEQRLRDEYNRNAQAREQLIQQARALLEAEDAFEASHQAKALQQSWKTLGTTDHARDRKLWSDFRALCDQIFERREQARNQRRSEREARDGAVAELLGEARQLLQCSDEGVADALSQLEALAERLQEQAPPAAWRKPLQEVENSLRDRQQELPRRAREASWAELRRRAGLCRALEQGELDVAALEAAWQQGPGLPENWEIRLRERVARAQAGTDDIQRSQNAQRARSMVLELEILVGAESPVEEQALRMEQQMARLGLFGQQRESAQEARERIELEWLALGQLPAQDFEQLEHRLRRALALFDDSAQKIS